MKNFLLALLSGIILAISWPTYGFPIFIFLGFVPLLYAEFKIRNFSESTVKLKVFALSYLTFFIWNVITTWWIYNSTPFGGVFAILANSLLMSIVFLLYHIVAKRTGGKGISPIYYKDIIGKRTLKDLQENHILKLKEMDWFWRKKIKALRRLEF